MLYNLICLITKSTHQLAYITAHNCSIRLAPQTTHINKFEIIALATVCLPSRSQICQPCSFRTIKIKKSFEHITTQPSSAIAHLHSLNAHHQSGALASTGISIRYEYLLCSRESSACSGERVRYVYTFAKLWF